MKNIFLFIFLLFATSHSVSAEPINFAGLDWSMTVDEMKRVLVNKGYSECDNIGMGLFWFQFTTYDRKDRCNEGTARRLNVTINSDPSIAKISFQCESFNGCGRSASEIKSAIENRYDITLTLTEVPFVSQIRYCGEGMYQDKICVSQIRDGVSSVSLLRHKFLKPSKGDLDF